jgi:hypothetical protein
MRARRRLSRPGDYDAMRIRSFAGERDGTLVAQWQLFREAALLQEATE